MQVLVKICLHDDNRSWEDENNPIKKGQGVKIIFILWDYTGYVVFFPTVVDTRVGQK